MKKDRRNLNIVGRELWDFLLQASSLNSVECFQLFISLLYLRRMDCQLKPYYKTIRNTFAHSFVDDDAIIDMTDGLTYYNVSGFSLDDVLTNPDDINYSFDKWIAGFDIESREVLSGLSFEPYIAIIKKNGYTYPLVHHLININLEKELSSEDIRDMYSLFSALSYGQFISPSSFSKCISPFLFHGVDTKDNINIYDPVCGTTLMLQEMEMQAEERNAAYNIECYASELNHSIYSLSRAFTVLCGKTYYNIECVNSLTSGFNNIYFDYVVADLPMGVKISSSEANDIEIINSYNDGVSVKSVPETYFIQMIMNRLKWDGRAAVITPERIFFDAQSDRFRSWLFKNDYVEAIIKLPKDKTFSNVDRYAWILTKEKTENFQDRIRLVDIQSMGDSAQDILADIDYLYSQSSNKKFKDYFRICWLTDISRYNIHLLNKKTGKKAETTIPISVLGMLELNKKGFVTTDHGGDWEVLFDKTTMSYSFTFKQFFEGNLARHKISSEIHSDLKSGLGDAVSAISSIIDLDIPNRKEMVNPQISSWAGEVPSEWQPISVQEIFDCSSAYKEDKPIKGGKLPLLNVKYLRGEEDKVEYTVPNVKSVVVDDDDLIIIKSGANAGEVLNGKKGVLGSTLFRMRFNSHSYDMTNRYFAKYMLMSMSQYFKTFNTSISIGFVKAKDINSAVAFIPSMDEQQRIVDFLRPVCEHIDTIQSSLGVEIPKLKDYRDVLIFEAVTGKLVL